MGIIEVPCANQECDSTDVSLMVSEIFLKGYKHRFQCNGCKTKFSICTVLTDVCIAQETKT